MRVVRLNTRGQTLLDLGTPCGEVQNLNRFVTVGPVPELPLL